MLPERKRPSFITQLLDLFLIELTNWRWSWQSMVTLSIIAPLLSMLGLWMFARNDGDEALIYILTGNLVLALMFGTLDKVQSHFMFLRYQGAFDFFATLPIRKLALLLAVVCAFFLLALPSTLVTLFVGSWLLGVRLALHPLLLLVLPVCTFPLAGIGALIGSYAKNPPEAGSISTLITFLFLGLGPVIIPPAQLPPLLVTLGRLSPATYAASAMRQTTVGPLTSQLWIDFLVLLVWGTAVFIIVERKMRWREVG